MKQLLLFLLATFSFFSCKRESTTLYTATISNNTNHKILIEYFENGSLVTEKNIILNPNSIFEIAKGVDKGISNYGGFDSDYYGDSAIVTFDDTFKIVHCFGNIISNSSKKYLYSSTRNLFNYLSYEYNYIDESKIKRNATYKYIFSEQDYLDTQ